jgi:hypothetical protein
MWGRIANLAGRSRVDLPVQWVEIGKYEIEKLRHSFIDVAVHDDDILTQFVERDELIRRLEKCDSFSDFVGTWRWLSHESA